MTKKARIMAAIAGAEVDRPPVAFWRHFPTADWDAERLARKTLEFQRRYDCDFVKLMPNGLYSVADWGVGIAYSNTPHKTDALVRPAIKRPEDWHRLKPLEVDRGVLGEMLKFLKLVSRGLAPDTPWVMTIFSPLTTAYKLAGERLFEDLRESRQAVHQALEVITETTVNFVRRALECGVWGLFFATQCASYTKLGLEEYLEFGLPYDLRVLQPAAAAPFNILHLHGERVMFELCRRYPVQAVNWHDRGAGPSLEEAQRLVRLCLIGGLDERRTLLLGNFEALREELREAVWQTGGQHLILGPGCVVPLEVPPQKLEFVRRAVEEL